MPSLGITRDEVYSNIATTVGIDRTSSNWDAQTLADVERIWRAGKRMFLSAHEWRHLEERYRIVIPAEFDDGTIEVVDGVVTLSGGTFPADAADYVLLPDDGGVYEVNTRDSDTQLTLFDTSYDLDSGSEYEMRRVHFPLPTNFAAFIEPLTIENSPVNELFEVPIVPEWTIRAIGSRDVAKKDRPEAFSFHQTVDEATNVFTPFVTVWPIPDDQYTLTSVIRVEPEDSLDQTGSTEICHPVFAELFQEAILAAAEKLYGHVTPIHTQAFQAMLPRFIQRDRVMRGVRHLRKRKTDQQLRSSSRFIDAQGYQTDFPFDE